MHQGLADLHRMPLRLVHRQVVDGNDQLIGLCARNQGKLTKKMYGAKQQNGYAVNLHVASNNFSSGIILSAGEITTLQHLAAVRLSSCKLCDSSGVHLQHCHELPWNDLRSWSAARCDSS